MTSDVRVSPEVDLALAAAGYRALAPGDDGALVAVALDGSERRVELHVLPADDTTGARVGAWRSVRHEHLVRVLEVVPLSAAEIGVFSEHLPGLSLVRLCAARGPLSDGEAATLAIPVAQALEAMHAVGIQHGGVGPRSILVDADGRPVLAGLGAALRHVPTASDESAADVRALLAAVLEPLAVPGTGGGDGSLGEALEDLLHEPAPSAARVVDRCFRVAVPQPVRLPDPTGTGRDVAHDLGSLRATARGDSGARARRGGARAGRHGATSGLRPASDVESGPVRGRGPAGRPGLARVMIAGACAVVLAAAVTVTVLVAPWRATTDGGTAAAAPGPVAGPRATSVPARTDPRDAAVALTQRRASLLAQGRTAALHEVEVVGSPAHEADSRLVAQLDGDRVSGLEVSVTDVERLEAPRDDAGSSDDEVRVQVTSTTSAYERVAADGSRRAGGPAATSTVVLVLRWTDQGWRVWDVATAT